MAKVKNNVMMRGISGTLGKQFVIRTMKDGSTIISAMPDFSNRKFSKGQLTQQSRLKEAAAYARPAAKTNPIYAKLAEGTTKNAYNIALSDWFNPPVIHKIQHQNGRIRIEASDKVLVSKVLVMILDSEGKIVEQGEAVFVKDMKWEYISATEGRVSVEAWDLAGNVARQEMEDSRD
jgi:hypothetical protein